MNTIRNDTLQDPTWPAQCQIQHCRLLFSESVIEAFLFITAVVQLLRIKINESE